MVGIILILLIAGCKNNQNSGTDDPENNPVTNPGGFDPSEFAYIPEFFYPTLPDGTSRITIDNLTYANGKLYFSSSLPIEDAVWDFDVKIYTMDFNGTNITQLPNYDIKKSSQEEAESNIVISAMAADKNGNIWIVENENHYIVDLPDNYSGSPGGAREHVTILDSITTLRKLDDTGAELFSLETKTLFPDIKDTSISSFAFDNEGYIYIKFFYEPNIYVLNGNGARAFTLSADGRIIRVIRISDGTVGCQMIEQAAHSVQFIDAEKSDWGESVELSDYTRRAGPGAGSLGLTYFDHMNFYAYDMEKEENIKLFSWIDGDIISDEVWEYAVLPDERIICITSFYNEAFELTFAITIFTKTPISEVPEKIKLTLASFQPNWALRNAVVRYNRESRTHRINVIDYYSELDDDYYAGYMRLVMDITTGSAPDLIDMENMPYRTFATRGLLEDLYPYIDADTQLSRDSLIEPALKAVEIDNKLYQVFSSFAINTVIGHPSVVGQNTGWDISEFISVVNANPQADMPFGTYKYRYPFFMEILENSIDDFVDWSKGDVFFDRGEFAKLMEFSKQLPSDTGIDTDYREIHELVATGSQIMATYQFSNLLDIQLYGSIFGGEIVFKGYPSESRNGNKIVISHPLAISTTCADKDAAWSFVKTIMSEDMHRRAPYNFPINKIAFNGLIEEAKRPAGFEIDDEGNEVEIPKFIWSFADGTKVYIYAVTSDEADRLRALVDSISGLSGIDEFLGHIISDSVIDYFNDEISQGEAVSRIQSRALIFISEQYG